MGEVELGEGEHKIEAHPVKTLRVNGAGSSSLIAHSKNQKQKLILVNKEERERIEKQIWQKIHPVRYDKLSNGVNQPETEVCYIFEKEEGEFWVK